jgi:hypothetical protein
VVDEDYNDQQEMLELEQQKHPQQQEQDEKETADNLLSRDRQSNAIPTGEQEESNSNSISPPTLRLHVSSSSSSCVSSSNTINTSTASADYLHSSAMEVDVSGGGQIAMVNLSPSSFPHQQRKEGKEEVESLSMHSRCGSG